MTTLLELEGIESDLLAEDDDYDISDRGEMYLRVHALTNSGSSVVEGNISTFSGLLGGTAFLANYVLGDRASYGGGTYTYSITVSGGSNDVYNMSQAVAEGYIGAVQDDFSAIGGNGGSLSIANGVTAARAVWNSNGGLVNQFPGNAVGITDYLSGSVLSLPEIGITDGDAASFSGVAGSILFGKSAEDFYGISGYAVINGPDSANSDIFGIQRYVLQYNTANVGATSLMAGDRNDDGLLNYDDGIVVMVESVHLGTDSAAWRTGVNTLLGFNYDLNWDAYRAWDLMSEFRVQLVEGGEYDFAKYAETNGTGAEKDFWEYTETLLNDSAGAVRNAVLYYDRVENGTSADNHLYGGNGQDVLSGDAGADIIRAGWNNDQLLGGDGADELYGEKGNDRLIGGEGVDILDGGENIDIADYSFDPDGITVSSISPTGNGSITDGWGDTDTLISIEHIKGSTYDDTFTFSTATGLTIDGNGGNDVVSYTNFEFTERRSEGAVLIYDEAGVNRDTIVNAQVDSYRGRLVIDDTQIENLSSPSNTLGRTLYDYSAASGPAAFVFNVSETVDFTPVIGFFDVDYQESVSVTLATGITHTGTLANASAVDLSAFDAVQFMMSAGAAYFQGTNYGDTFTIQGDGRTPVTLATGSGDDTLFLGEHTNSASISYRGGDDAIYVEENGGVFHAPRISFLNGITPDLLTITYNGTSLFVEIDGYGSLYVDHFDGSELYFAGGASITFSGTTPVIHSVTDNDVGIAGTWGDDVWADHGVWDESYYAYGGNDVINGSTGDNRLYGGDGNDTYVYDGLGGNSTLTDLAGTDVIYVTDDTIHQENLFYEQDGNDLIISFSNGTNFDGTPAFSGSMTIAGFYGDHGSTISTLRLSDGSTDIDLNNPASLDFYLIGSASAESLSAFNFGNSFIFGLGGNDVIDGAQGNDAIYGGDGDDSLYGNDGDDLLDGGEGTNDLQGGAGNDTYVLSGTAYNTVDDFDGTNRIITDQNPTEEYDISDGLILKDAFGDPYAQLYGSLSTITFADHSVLSVNDIYTDHIVYYQTSEDADEIAPQENGTFGDFSIDLLGGDDEYRGGSATDIVDGGYGYDFLQGGGGDDILRGGADSDDLQGGEGNDLLDGGRDIDVVNYANDYGATSGVTVNLSLGLTTSDGFGTVDTLVSIEDVLGSWDDDDITGSAVDNVLLALDGNDILNGLGGNDHLDGGAGNDVIDGGAGDDVINGGDGDDEINGGEGVDTVTYSSATSAVTVSLATATAQNTGGAGTDTLSGIESIIGSAYNDTLTGDSGDNEIEGGVGDDTINGGAGNDILSGGTGSNILYGDDGNDTLIGNSAADSIYGGAGNDSLLGGAADDYLYGGDDNDILEGGTGDDYLAGDGGTDTASYTLAMSAVTVNLATTTAQNTGGAGTDTLATIENLIGSDYNDTLTGNGSANMIEGGDGDDAINGAGGTDTVSYAGAASAVTVNLATGTAQDTVGAGTDTLTSMENLLASAYNDTITGSSGNNVIEGGAGNDTLDGSGGTDTASYASASAAVTVSLALGSAQNTFGAGIDTLTNFENLTGSAFGDVLTGSSGNNTITGGDGDDIAEGGDGNDTMTGGNGRDTVSFSNAASAITFNLATTTSQNTVGAGSDTVSGFDNILGSAYNDTLTGNITDNVIEGGAGDDTIDGGSGNDTVSYEHAASAVTVSLAIATAQNTGGAGTDTLSSMERLLGSAYNDTLTGSAGNNTIDGGAGNDLMDGGNGIDIASYASAGSAVTVDLSNTSAQNTGGAGTDTLSSFENLIGSNYNDTLTGTTGGNSLLGGEGDDTIYGNSGNDTLKGGNGNDTLSGQAGTDTLYGEGGSDIFAFEVASAFTNQDTIADFSISDGDILDISALLVGWNPTQSAIDDFVTFGTSGSDMTVSIDRDGTGGTYSAQAIATLSNITGLDADDLLANGQLLAA